MPEPEPIDTKQRIATGPLGVIAVFLAFVESLAVIALVWTSSLSDGQRWTFVIFAVAFPSIAFLAFCYLVICHHRKLYPPSAFKNEELVFGQQPPEVIEARRNEEAVESLESARATVATPAEPRTETETSTDVSPAIPPDNSGDANYEELLREHRDEYRLAEELAIRDLAVSLGSAARRDVLIQGAIPSPFDAVFETPSRLHLAEVKLSSTYRLSRQFGMTLRIRVEHANRVLVRAFPDKTIVFHVYVVVRHLQAGQEEGVFARVRELLGPTNARVEVHCKSLETLKSMYPDV